MTFNKAGFLLNRNSRANGPDPMIELPNGSCNMLRGDRVNDLGGIGGQLVANP
jgi:hypothetical protein